MPNICTAMMYVKGYKDNVDEFIKIMNADYSYTTGRFSHDRHFFRVFSTYVYDYDVNGVEAMASINFECAWSVYTCLFNGPHTYYDDTCEPITIFNRNIHNINWADIIEHRRHATHILAEADRLNLKIEIYATEPGMGFAEEYKIIGKYLIQDEELPYDEYYIYDFPTKQDYEKECGEIPISAEQYLQYKKDKIDIVGYPEINDDASPFITNDNDMVKLSMVKIVK